MTKLEMIRLTLVGALGSGEVSGAKEWRTLAGELISMIEAWQKEASAPPFTPEEIRIVRAAAEYLESKSMERIAEKMSAPSEKP